MKNASPRRQFSVLRFYVSVRALAIVCLFGGSVSGSFGASSFTGLGSLPGGKESFAEAVSGNGLVVVGAAGDFSGPHMVGEAQPCQAFRWTAKGGMVGLGFLPGQSNSVASAVSYDGSVIVGSSDSVSATLGFRWTAAGGMVPLKPLPNDTVTEARGISGDGMVMAGTSSGGSPEKTRACRWTAAGDVADLGLLPRSTGSMAYAVSSNGKVVVGDSFSPLNGEQGFGLEAFRWTAAKGMVSLGKFPFGFSMTRAVSRDGSVVVGGRYRWTQAGGMVELAFPHASNAWFALNGVSGDGAVIVGYLECEWDDKPGKSEIAIIWDSVHGMRNLQSVLTNEYHLNLDGWQLFEATGISADGRTIVGSAEGRPGGYEGWMVHLDRPVNAAVKKK